jgi:hypothetical protein
MADDERADTRWLSYEELAAARGIDVESARRIVRLKKMAPVAREMRAESAWPSRRISSRVDRPPGSGASARKSARKSAGMHPWMRAGQSTSYPPGFPCSRHSSRRPRRKLQRPGRRLRRPCWTGRKHVCEPRAPGRGQSAEGRHRPARATVGRRRGGPAWGACELAGGTRPLASLGRGPSGGRREAARSSGTAAESASAGGAPAGAG